ncbi:transporter substrate-binding domain-containing protein [Undibacterium cyanobacteriorum]|uniref:Transporter substrate-binding domain-containing protein n=1 Tax=Undibacterium cyanobacteriorum TaxID=3073561 RepID=A0ABY9RD83_9BURK|nr:transporter substrate-binding domain-containing protein [Undibacterium sp. 20NA77.5]WMW79205.1 transporter substrate-binding domain-containing protein [Undibacterium sp. 20NA77.5]
MARNSLTQYLLILFTTLLVSLLFVQGNAAAQTRVPLLFGENKNEKGEYVPMPERFTKMFQFVEKDLNIKFDFQMYPWNRAIKIASTDGGVIFGLSRTPERENLFHFSEPALHNYLWLITRHDRQFPFDEIADLRGKTIGVVRGARYGGEFDEHKGKLFRIDDDIDAYGPRLQKVLNGRVDAMLIASSSNDAKEVERQVNMIKIDERERVSASNRFKVLSSPVLRDGICFAALKGSNDALVDRISNALLKYHALDLKSAKSRGKAQR